MTRKRTTLKDRQARAIAATMPPVVDPAPTTTAEQAGQGSREHDPDPAPSRPVEPAPARPKPRAATDTRLVGSWWYRPTYDRARSAYLVDLDTVDHPPTTFARWIARAIEAHNARTPAQRAAAAEQLGEEATEGTGLPRTHVLPARPVQAIEDALRQERQAGRVLSASQYIAEAVRVATAESEARHGRPLPPPPARLPSRATG